MRLVRMIVALLVALALAALPLGAPAMAMPVANASAPADMHVHAVVQDNAMMGHGSHMSSHMAMDEPCHHQTGKSDQVPHKDTKCPMGACCVGVSVLAAPLLAKLTTPLVYTEGRFPARIDRFVPEHAGRPPFRPPRA